MNHSVSYLCTLLPATDPRGNSKLLADPASLRGLTAVRLVITPPEQGTKYCRLDLSPETGPSDEPGQVTLFLKICDDVEQGYGDAIGGVSGSSGIVAGPAKSLSQLVAASASAGSADEQIRIWHSEYHDAIRRKINKRRATLSAAEAAQNVTPAPTKLSKNQVLLSSIDCGLGFMNFLIEPSLPEESSVKAVAMLQEQGRPVLSPDLSPAGDGEGNVSAVFEFPGFKSAYLKMEKERNPQLASKLDAPLKPSN